MVVLGRSADKNIRLMLDNVIGVYPVNHICPLAVSVKMVKIFKKPEVKCFFYISIRLILRKPCGQINCDLFIPKSRFKNGLFGRCHPVYGRLLGVFNSPDFGNCFADICVRTKPLKMRV